MKKKKKEKKNEKGNSDEREKLSKPDYKAVISSKRKPLVSSPGDTLGTILNNDKAGTWTNGPEDKK